MELELVRFVWKDLNGNKLVHFTQVLKKGVRLEGHSLNKDAQLNATCTEIGRIPIHQEDAYTLGLKVGDVL